MGNDETGLSAAEIRDLRDIAGTMIPAKRRTRHARRRRSGHPGRHREVRRPRSAAWSARRWRRSRQESGGRLRRPGPRQARSADQRLLRRAAALRPRRSGGWSWAPITATTGCCWRSGWRPARPSPRATRWNRATGPCSMPCAIARLCGATTDRRRPGSAEMAGNEKVDVLIIGSGASGAAVAWSLADTRMRILCLEQGDWMKSTDFPSNGRDWEARRYTDFDISPNRRGRDTDYPVNDDNSPMKIANFNGVGGGTVIYTAHWPRMHPSDFKVKSLDGVADDWPIDYWALERVLRRERPHDGRVRPRRRSGRAAAPPADAADPARQDRHALCPGDEQAGLALVAVGHHHRHHATTTAARPASTSATARRAARRAPRPAPTSPTGRSPSAPASSCARAAGCARSPPTSTAWRPARSTTTPTGASTSSRPRS